MSDEKYSIVWDLETTGFVAPAAKILEIGCLIVRGEEVEQKHWVLDNKVEIPEKITEITGIDQAIIDAEGRDPVECLNEFLPLFKNAEQNITHNGIKFDIPFLLNTAVDLFDWDETQRKAAKTVMMNSAFDTAPCVKGKKLEMSQMDDELFYMFAERVMNVRAYGVYFKLQESLKEEGVELDVEAHRAMADVQMTHALYKIVKEYDCIL
jgi:DNA polymerase III alpha subunit (gram-positive type)